MKLYEEFLNRINVQVPVVEHNTDWAFLFRTYGKGWATPYIMMTVLWTHVENRVGYYLINYHQALHNGFQQKNYFRTQASNEARIVWDEYDNYFGNFKAKQHMKPGLEASLAPIYGENAMLFAAWEMFVYMHDAWIAIQPPEFRVYVEGSIDDIRSDNDRIKSYQNALLFLTMREPAILKTWKNDVIGRMRNYGHWLGRLLTNDGETKSVLVGRE